MAKANQGNKDYWHKRFEQLEDEQYRRSAAYYQDLQEQFRRASNDIQMDIGRWYQRLADNNDISLAGAKRLLKKNDLKEFHWTVEQYIKAGEENAVDQRWMKQLENASARHHISYLDAMKLQIQQHAELLSTEYEGGMTDFLHKSYADNYYHSAYEIAKGTSVGSNLARLDDKRIDMVIRKPWAQDGAAFSDRIWSNKQKLVNTLHTELSQNIIRGASPQKAIDSLARTMDVSRSQAGRLVMTESAAIASAAKQDCLKELGVEQYEIVATLDSHTSEICRDMDGKVFAQKDYEVGVTAPPFHPNCRTTTAPYFDDEFTAEDQRAARGEDGKTHYVPADMKYREWEKKYVKESAGQKGRVLYEGVPKTWEKLTEVSDSVNVNPSGSKENCVNCTVAYEMRRRGYAVVAGEPIKKLQREPFSAWKNPDIRTIGKNENALEGIKEDMKKWGDGSRAQISVIWNPRRGTGTAWNVTSNMGHSFVAEQRDGKTFFLDVQTGKEYNENIFNRVTENEVRYCRIDMLEINDLGSTACRKE